MPSLLFSLVESLANPVILTLTSQDTAMFLIMPFLFWQIVIDAMTGQLPVRRPTTQDEVTHGN